MKESIKPQPEKTIKKPEIPRSLLFQTSYAEDFSLIWFLPDDSPSTTFLFYLKHPSNR